MTCRSVNIAGGPWTNSARSGPPFVPRKDDDADGEFGRTVAVVTEGAVNLSAPWAVLRVLAFALSQYARRTDVTVLALPWGGGAVRSQLNPRSRFRAIAGDTRPRHRGPFGPLPSPRLSAIRRDGQLRSGFEPGLRRGLRGLEAADSPRQPPFSPPPSRRDRGRLAPQRLQRRRRHGRAPHAADDRRRRLAQSGLPATIASSRLPPAFPTLERA